VIWKYRPCARSVPIFFFFRAPKTHFDPGKTLVRGEGHRLQREPSGSFYLRKDSFNPSVVCSTRDRKVHKEGRLSYADFVWFLISEEDKKTDTRYTSSVSLTLLLPSNVLTSFTIGANLTPAIKTSRKWLELILFPKFKCQVLYVCLLTN